MTSIQQDMEEFQRQLSTGAVTRAYRALLAYMLDLRTHFEKNHPDFGVSGLYQGYMDMTYFAIFPPALKQRDLKIAIVFNYETFRFEVWLSPRNRNVHRQYWELFKDSHWPAYRVVPPAKEADSMVECDLANDVDFSDLEALTSTIETGTLAFIAAMERFLSEHQGTP
ncbi:MAG: hypothetical protein KJ065_17025 [Anaerolineae bacterium]|nr:hypothetical protein [Anaerolineae bacterium]